MKQTDSASKERMLVKAPTGKFIELHAVKPNVNELVDHGLEEFSLCTTIVKETDHSNSLVPKCDCRRESLLAGATDQDGSQPIEVYGGVSIRVHITDECRVGGGAEFIVQPNPLDETVQPLEALHGLYIYDPVTRRIRSISGERMASAVYSIEDFRHPERPNSRNSLDSISPRLRRGWWRGQ